MVGLPHPHRDARFYDGVRGRRVAALLVDAMLVTAAAAFAVLAFGVATLGVGLALGLPIALTVSFLYRFLTLARWSATPGMALFGIEARGWSGERLSDAEAAIHTGVFLLCFHLVAPQMISLALMALRPDGRGLHDLAIGGAVINAPADSAADMQAG
ncbi:RDD family protein [Rubrimonas cliftonensis]|uniref:RDD family protein n=1 Tax=Rubrimonas cliftonensis TaxID=89524 RepID=A0A1H3W1M4_9RHOB|nr:RDD family protein [Rubrimonas cliftonensis]SDZ80953.1 RDD family protein [Rubrimonas cliftonensis]